MEPELKAKWLSDLRSGRIEQAKGVLCDRRGRMCCLGVLRHAQDPMATYEGQTHGEGTSELNKEHMAGLSIDQMHKLADMNDDGKTFAEIADWIEKKL